MEVTPETIADGSVVAMQKNQLALTYLFLHENFWRSLLGLIFLASFGVTVERNTAHRDFP